MLIFETLAERTLALAQLARRSDPEAGFEPLMPEFLRPVLADCLQHGIRIVSNFGAANPQAAARTIHRLAQALGTRIAVRIAVVHGDDLSGPAHRPLLAEALAERMPAQELVSANAYIGAQPIAAALQAGADIVVCGRVSDPPWSLARPWPTTAGPGTTGTAWAGPRHHGRSPAGMRHASDRRLLR